MSPLQNRWQFRFSRSTQPPQSPSVSTASRGSSAIVLISGLVCVFLLFILLKHSAESQSQNAEQHPAVGKPAPQLDLIVLTNTTQLVRPSIELEDRVTLIHFWGTWCPPCRAEYPHLSELANELVDHKKFQFVPISCESNPGETFDGLWKKTSAFFAKESIEDPAFADPRGITRVSLTDRLEQPNLYYPTSVLVGPDEKISRVWQGYDEQSVDDIVASVKQLISEAHQSYPEQSPR